MTDTKTKTTTDPLRAAYEAGYAVSIGGGWSRLLVRQAVGAAERGELSWALVLADRACDVADRRDEAAHRAFLTALEAVVPTPRP